MFFKEISSHHSEDEFQLLYDKYNKLLYKFAYRILKDHHDTEDALQLAYCKIFQYIDKIYSLDEKQKINYMITIVVNISKNMYNKKKRTVACSLDERIETGQENSSYYDNICSDLPDAIKKLDEIYRTPLLLKFTYGCSVAEIADLLEISVTNVTTRIYRGKKIMKDMLQKESDADEK